MIVADCSGISSAGETVFSNSLASAALFVFCRDPSSLVVPIVMVLVDEPTHHSC